MSVASVWTDLHPKVDGPRSSFRGPGTVLPGPVWHALQATRVLKFLVDAVKRNRRRYLGYVGFKLVSQNISVYNRKLRKNTHSLFQIRPWGPLRIVHIEHPPGSGEPQVLRGHRDWRPPYGAPQLWTLKGWASENLSVRPEAEPEPRSCCFQMG